MSSLLATCALLVVTKDLIPFTLTLLGLAVAVEVSACLNHWLTERWVVAFAVNLAALLMIFIAAALPASRSLCALHARGCACRAGRTPDGLSRRPSLEPFGVASP